MNIQTGSPTSAAVSLSNPWAVVPSLGHLDAYISAVNRLPMLSLEPLDRTWLHKRIEQRFDDMLAHGFIEEVKALRTRGDLQIDLPSMRCVGYRQAWEALDGSMPMSELRDRGVFATRQLAKRQLTWLRSMPLRHVIQADASDVLPQALQWLDAQLS